MSSGAMTTKGRGEQGPTPTVSGMWWPIPLIRIGIAVFLTSVGVLHVVQPELDPRWRYLSEYALGEHGWLMTAGFVGLGAAFLGAVGAIGWAGPARRTARLAQVLLAVAGAGSIVAAAFETDPITVPPDQASATGSLHQAGAGLAAAIPFAVLLVWLVLRSHQRWPHVRPFVLSASLLAVASSIAAAVVVAGYGDAPHGPDRIDGLVLRVELACTAGWLLVLAWALTRLGRPARTV